jgi:hypothetical protein
MSNMTFKERCTVAVECLPNAPYRTMLANLLDEMLAALAQPAAQRSGCTAGTDEECTQRGCATKCPQLQPAAQQEPAGKPYAWHYQNKGGSSVLHLQPGKRLDADMQAAKDFPQAHFITALFTRPAVPLTDAQREWIVATCPTPASIISAVEAALIGGAE